MFNNPRFQLLVGAAQDGDAGEQPPAAEGPHMLAVNALRYPDPHRHWHQPGSLHRSADHQRQHGKNAGRQRGQTASQQG